MKKTRILGFFLFGLCLLQAATAQAAREYLVVQNLDFGDFSVARNNANLSITVAPDGSTGYDAGIYPDTLAKPAQYTLTGLPPNMTLTIGVTTATPPLNGGLEIDNSTGLTNGGAPPFTISNFTCNNPTTDGSGNATLLIGATLTTTGLGGYYNSGDYLGTLDLTFYLD